MSAVVQGSLIKFGRTTTLLSLAVSIFLMSVFFFTVFKLESVAIKQQEKSFSEQQFLQTRITQKAFQATLNNIKNYTLEFSQFPARQVLANNFPIDQFEKELSRITTFHPSISGTILFDGNQQVHTNTINNEPKNSILHKTVGKWVKQNWIALSSAEIELIVPPFYATSQEQFFALMVPIRTGKKLVGVLVTVVDISVLSNEYIAPMRSGKHGAGYMINESGLILYDHEIEIIGRNIFDGLHKNFPDLQRIDRLLISQLSGQGEYHFTVTRQGKKELLRKLTSWNKVQIDNKYFVISLSAPDTEIVGPIQELRQHGIFMAIVLSFGLVLVTILIYKNTNRALIRTTLKLEEEIEVRTNSLNKTEKSYRDTVQNAGIGIYRTTPEGKFLRANPYLVRMNNCNTEEDLIQIANSTVDQWYIKHDRRDEFKKIMAEKGYVDNFVSEVATYNSDHNKWISETARAIHDENNEILYYEGTVQDVTHLVIAKEAQQKSEANLRAHITAMPDLGIIFSLSGKILDIYGNQNLLAQPREEMIGKSLNELASVIKAEKWLQIIKMTAETGDVQSHEYNLTINKDLRWFEARSSLIKDVPNSPSRIVILIRDITQRHLDKQVILSALENADIANRSKTEFLANMSHELRTPLNAILGYSDIMIQELFGPVQNDKYQEYITDIHTSGQHLLDIINDILYLSKIEAGTYVPDETTTELSSIIKDTNRIINGAAIEKGIAFIIEEIPNISLRCDPRAIKQVVINLLSNAIKFTPRGGNVDLSTTIGINGLTLIIKDTGIGIKKSDIPRVLEPFVRVGTSQITEESGTGIGLSLTKKLVEFHEGTLEIESMINEGTTVTVTFPTERIINNN
ncbi:ATP-binding protein [Kiloniella antarctica]|uniref:histidine kinase n=1 Tax=Kiloniella antarctica TaxID=1550907 RepID=A0ABW5BPD0_9PROT